MKVELTSAELGKLAEIKGYLTGIAKLEEHHRGADEYAKWLGEWLDKVINSYKSV